jgi:large subunit ribosomal protein L6
MSRLIKKTIPIPSGVTVTDNGTALAVKGPKGELSVKFPRGSAIAIEGTEARVVAGKGVGADQSLASQGTLWALVRNAIEGVTNGFTKVLEIEGVGYGASIEGKDLVLKLGYALPVRKPIPANVTVTVDKNAITVVGLDKEAVGQAAAEIRALKKPEPYKGKGIRYQGEVIRRKVGKKAGTGA